MSSLLILVEEKEYTHFFIKKKIAADLPFFKNNFFNDFFYTVDYSILVTTPPVVYIGRVRPNTEISPLENKVISKVAKRWQKVFFFKAIL